MTTLPYYRTLHPSRQILSDTQLQCFPCIFNDDFVLVTEGREINAALSDRCPYNDLVRNMLYGILTEQDGQRKHIDDSYSLARAQSVVRHLSFSGGYNCCWETRRTRLPITTWNGLYERFSAKMPIHLPLVLVSLFWCNEHGAVGFRLHNTPWADECLEILEVTAATLRRGQLVFGPDEHLVDLPHLARQADIRLLVLDPFAPTLEGLPLYDD